MRYKISLALAVAGAMVLAVSASAFAGPRTGGWGGPRAGFAGRYAGTVAGAVTGIGNGTITISGVQDGPWYGNLPAGTYPLSAWVKVVLPGEGAHGSVSQALVGDLVRLVVGPTGLVDIILVHPYEMMPGSSGSTLAAPANVTAAEAATGISVSWTAVSGATGYQVLASTGGGYTAVGATSGGTPTASGTTITGLSAGSTYTFEVEAEGSGTTSAPSAPSNAVAFGANAGTAALADVSYSFGVWCGTVTVAYDKPLDAASLDQNLTDFTIVSNGKSSHPTSVTVSGGEIQFGEDVCIGGGALDTVQVTTTQTVVNDLAGAPTSPINAASTLGNGTGVLAWESATGVSLSWGAVTGASGYDVLVSSGSGYTPVPATNGGAPNANSTVVTGLSPGMTYTFEVAPIVAGTSSAPSQPSNAVEWGAKAYAGVTTSNAQSSGQDTLTFTITYDKDLSAGSADSSLSDYTVTDLTTGVAIPLSAVSVRGNTLVLEAAGVPSTSVNASDLIRVSTAASAVNDANGAPTTPIDATGTV